MITPIIKLDDSYLKREDQNLTGSVKDRAIELQIQHLHRKNINSAVISSTGNAAISAAFFCRQYDINLTVFVSPKINQDKLKLISPACIIKSDKAISDAFKFAKTHYSYLLRQSTDEIAIDGYSNLGSEINKQLPQVTSIFFPVGSGTTLLGTSQKLSTKVKIFAVQPASNPTIVKYFNQHIPEENVTITDALTVKMLPLKQQVISAINKSNGLGIYVTNDQVISAQKLLQNLKISTSPEGALTLAGYLKAKETLQVGEYPLIILTGANRSYHG